jgi:L-Ala-D/L-Glu epimerase / N-acetyl-D-glutamate racemase
MFIITIKILADFYSIMNVKIKKLRLQLAHNWTISRNTSSYKDNVFINIENNGITGIGEAAPNVRYNENADMTIAALNNAVSFLQQSDLNEYQNVIQGLKDVIVNQNCALAAADIAIMDWFGKSKNMPVYKLFDLNPQKIPLTSYSIGIDSIPKMQKKVEEFSHMPIFKIKLGTDKDREIISGIRQVTNKPIRVDANEGWKKKEKALADIEWLAGQNVEFVEQPMPSAMLEDMVWLKEKSPLELFADESVIKRTDIPDLKNAFHGINIKLMKAGGIIEALAMIKTARSLNMNVMLGCMIESSVAIAAAAHIAALVDYVDLDGSLLLASDPYTGVEIKNGKIILNTLPGLGVSEK